MPPLNRYALGLAARFAVVVPVALVLTLKVLDAPELAPLTFFGAAALLTFVDFDGPTRTRLRNYVLLAVAGSGLVTLGTLCSTSPVLATAGMAVVGFCVLFSGVLDHALQQASRAALLAFVLPTLIPLSSDSLSQRLAGWLLGCGLALASLLIPWPRRPPNQFLTRTAAAARAFARAVQASAAPSPAPPDTAAPINQMHRAYLKTPVSPSARGVTLGQLVDDVMWVDATPLPPPRGAADALLPEAEEETRDGVSSALEDSARLLEHGGGTPDLDALVRARTTAREAFMRRVEAWRAGEDEPLEASLRETFQLRSLALAAWQLGVDTLRVLGRPLPQERPNAEPRRSRVRELAAAHLTLRSVWLRTSLRGAIGLSIAVLVGQLTDLHHAFWVVLGTLGVLRSQAATTGTTLVKELAGNVAGVVVAGVLLVLVGTDTAVLWALLVPVALIATYVRKVFPFPGGQAAFSFQMLIVFNLIQPTGWRLGLVRIEDIAIGAAISMVVSLLMWPLGASGRLRADVGDAYERWAGELVAAIRRQLSASPVQRPSRAAAASWLRLDATLRQYLTERAGALSFDDVSELVAGVTRLRRVREQLADEHQMLPLQPPAQPVSPGLEAARAALAEEVDGFHAWYLALADAIRHGRPPPAPRAAAAAPTRLRHADEELLERLAVTWALQRLEHLRTLEPRLTAATAHIARPDAAPEPSPRVTGARAPASTQR